MQTHKMRGGTVAWCRMSVKTFPVDHKTHALPQYSAIQSELQLALHSLTAPLAHSLVNECASKLAQIIVGFVMGFDGNSKEVDATVVIKEDPTCFDDLRGRGHLLDVTMHKNTKQTNYLQMPNESRLALEYSWGCL